MGGILLGFIAFVLATTCVSACGEDSSRVYNVRQKRNKLSENVVIGMDYLGKPKIVCHCDAAGLQRLASKRFLTSKRDTILTVRPKRHLKKRQRKLNEAEDQKLQNDPIYSTTCCKIDFSSPRKLYSYPFTLKLSGQTYSDKLADKSSQEYLQLKKQLIDGLTALLANDGCVVAIELSGFRKGSLLADVVLSVQGLISQSIIDTLRSAIESGNIGGLQVQIVPEPEPTQSPPKNATQPPTKPTNPPTQPATKPTTKPTTQPTSKPTTKPATPSPEKTKTHDESSTAPTPPAETATKAPTKAPTVAPTKPSTQTSAPVPTKAGPQPSVKPTIVATIAPTSRPAPTAASATAKPTTPAPSTTPAPPKPKIPVESRPTIPYNTNTPGKEFKVNIIMPDKSFDANLNKPSSFQYLELKKMIEESLKEIFQTNAEFLSVTVLSFTPVSSPSTAKASRRSTQPMKGVEVSLDFKFRNARPGLLVPLETQLQIGSIASHTVSPDMTAVIIKDMDQPSGPNGPNGPSGQNGQCPSTCRQPSVCAPACSTTCCSPPVSSCPSPCPSRCAPSCSLSCCALTKRSLATSQN